MFARRLGGLASLAFLLATLAGLLAGCGTASGDRDHPRGPSAAPGIECVTTRGEGTWCEKDSLLGGDARLLLAVSPDGLSAYEAPYPPENEKTILYAYDRDPSTGSLVEKAGSAGCIADRPRKGCQTGRALHYADMTMISPDGKNVYVSNGGTLAIFDRDAVTGELTQKSGNEACINFSPRGEARDCISYPIGEILDMAISPDGRQIYVSTSGALFELDRDPTGALSLSPGSAPRIREPAGSEIAISPDGKNLYALGGPFFDAQLMTFARDSQTGALARVPGRAGCVSAKRTGHCRSARALFGGFLVVSPDGRNVYAGNSGPTFKDNGNLLTFDRLPDGTLVQKPGRAGCISEGGLIMKYRGCAKTSGIQSLANLGISRDGETVFVNDEYPFAAPTLFTRHPSGRLTPR